MSTKMSEAHWEQAVDVFRACLPARGAKAKNDRLFLEALHHFIVHKITLRALPERFGNWNTFWLRFDPLSGRRLCRPEGARQGRCVRRLLRNSGRAERHGAPCADVRLDHDPCTCLGGGRKRFSPFCSANDCRALGASRAGARSLAQRVRHESPFDNRSRRACDRVRA